MKCKKSKNRDLLYPLDMMACKIGEYRSTDLFEFKGRDFVLRINTVSKYIFIDEIRSRKTNTIIKLLEKFTLMLGLLTVLKSNGRPEIIQGWQ